MKKLLVSVLLPFILAHTSSAQNSMQQNLNKMGLAIDGYDPVAYFEQGKAVKGKKEFSVQAGAATYLLSTSANAQLFKANPSRYLPQYGGWCAFAMGATGEKVEIDPETFKILDGKLYLFYNKFFNNTLKSWNKDEPNLRRKADANWQKINP